MLRKDIPLNVKLDPVLKKKLEDLATASCVTMSQVVRAAVVAQHAMRFGKIPCCADGSRCYVPHLHADQIPTSPVDPPPYPAA